MKKSILSSAWPSNTKSNSQVNIFRVLATQCVLHGPGRKIPFVRGTGVEEKDVLYSHSSLLDLWVAVWVKSAASTAVGRQPCTHAGLCSPQVYCYGCVYVCVIRPHNVWYILVIHFGWRPTLAAGKACLGSTHVSRRPVPVGLAFVASLVEVVEIVLST